MHCTGALQVSVANKHCKQLTAGRNNDACAAQSKANRWEDNTRVGVNQKGKKT
jgi:hypothetical protein